MKDVRQSRVGDTVTDATHPADAALGSYRDPQPMVYSGLFPIDGSDYPLLRDALDKLRLNDAALVYEPESSAALGFGFRAASSACSTSRSCGSVSSARPAST